MQIRRNKSPDAPAQHTLELHLEPGESRDFVMTIWVPRGQSRPGSLTLKATTLDEPEMRYDRMVQQPKSSEGASYRQGGAGAAAHNLGVILASEGGIGTAQERVNSMLAARPATTIALLNGIESGTVAVSDDVRSAVAAALTDHDVQVALGIVEVRTVAEAGESDLALQERVLGKKISVTLIPSSELLSDAPRSFELAPGNTHQFIFRADSDRFLNVAIANLPYATTVRLLGAEGRVIHTSTRGAREGVTISASIPAGTYTVSIEATEAAFPEGQGQIGPVARGYALTLTATTPSRTRIEGVISREGSGEVMPVSLSVAEFDPETGQRKLNYLATSGSEAISSIDPARPVWVVVHGRDSSESKNNIEALALALFKQGYQVVTVDWAEAARDFSYSGLDPLCDAQWTPAVGRWIASQLDDLRIPHTNVSFVGHSHGSYVSYFAAVALGATGEKPHNLVALDPARDPVFVGGFDESQIDFSTAAANSTAVKANVDRVSQALALQTIPTLGPTLGAAALGDQFEFGDENLTRTARYHYELVMPGMIDPFQAHSYPIERFIRAIQEHQDLSGPLEM